MRVTHLAFVLPLSLANLSLAQDGVPVDSVVLKRKPAMCPGCSIPDVVLRRHELPSWILDSVDIRARHAGFYQLPVAVLGKVPWCKSVMSDAVMATLSIYRGASVATVQGYHHCLGGYPRATSDPPVPVEKQRLLDLESLIDSAARRTGRFQTRQPNERSS